MKPVIDSLSFGTITVDGKTLQQDVVILPDGNVIRRNKKPSKNKFGSGHRLARAELEEYFGCCPVPRLIVGTGHSGVLCFSDGAARFLDKHTIKAEFFPSPEAIRRFNEAPEGTAAIIHVTC